MKSSLRGPKLIHSHAPVTCSRLSTFCMEFNIMDRTLVPGMAQLVI